MQVLFYLYIRLQIIVIIMSVVGAVKIQSVDKKPPIQTVKRKVKNIRILFDFFNRTTSINQLYLPPADGHLLHRG